MKHRVGVILIGVFFCLLLWVGQNVKSMRMAYRIADLEKQMKKEQILRDSLSMEKEKLLALADLETRARGVWGFQDPKAGQIVLLKVKR